jgi:hypothetical protein
VEGEARLRGIELVLQLAHTALSAAQHLEDRETRIVGERVKELCGAAEVRGGASRCGHGHDITSRKLDLSTTLFVGSDRHDMIQAAIHERGRRVLLEIDAA